MAINTEKYRAESRSLVGRLTPFFLRGKGFVKFLMAIASPLDKTNESFRKWTESTLVDAVTTSQVIILKWSLKVKLKKYFRDENDEFYFNTYGVGDYTTVYENQVEHEMHTEAIQIFMPEDPYDDSVEEYSPVIIRDREELIDEGTDIIVAAPPHKSLITDEEYFKLIRQGIDPYLAYDIDYKIIIKQ